MAKSKKRKEIIKKNKAAQSKFFKVTIIVTIVLIALLYMVYMNVT
ncbi:MAG: hypothetical protein AAGA77_08490 [Bacteroidota bacterium]